MNWYLSVLKQYAVFSGRARRKEYWMFTLFNIIGLAVASIIDSVIGLPLFISIYALVTLLPAWGVTIRRLHDTGRSGWWFLVSLIPAIGAFVFLYFCISDSEANENQYGPCPKVNAL